MYTHGGNMNISQEKRHRMNAMYYRDGLTKEEIAHLLKFSPAFVDRYITSVDRRIERSEITRETIINGVNHLRVPYTQRPEIVEITSDNKPTVKKEEAMGPDSPEMIIPLKDLPDGMIEKLSYGFESLAIPAMRLLIDAFDKGTLVLRSLTMSRDNEYVITLKEVKE